MGRTLAFMAAVALLVGCGDDDAPALSGEERAACGAVRDAYATLELRADFDDASADLLAFASAANTTDNDALIESGRGIRTGVDAYEDWLESGDQIDRSTFPPERWSADRGVAATLWELVVVALAGAGDECERLGLPPA